MGARGDPIARSAALTVVCAVGLLGAVATGQPSAPPAAKAIRFPTNPLITTRTSASLGDNINGPTVIRVPAWVKQPLSRYYMYFAHHMGHYIRLAYADAL